MKLRCGPDWELEELATELLRADRRESKSSGPKTRRRVCRRGKYQVGDPAQFHLDEINDWLDDDQLDLRSSREILNSIGIADATYLRGQYSRAYNPEINRRPGPKHLLRPGMDPWRQQVWEEVDDWWYHPGRMCYPRPEKVGWF